MTTATLAAAPAVIADDIEDPAAASGLPGVFCCRWLSLGSRWTIPGWTAGLRVLRGGIRDRAITKSRRVEN